MRRKKRAVSPLIATVLLISFAVALGSVVLNWGRNLDISSEDICSEVEIQIKSLGNSDVCYKKDGDRTYLNFVIENEGNIKVEGLGIWVVGQKGTKILDFDQLTIQPKGVLDVNDDTVSYNADTFGDLKSVQFLPKVKNEDDVIDICPSNAIKIDKIRFC